VDGESDGWLDSHHAAIQDPIHLAWMVNQTVG
jgi:hypothetical protein